MHLLEAINLFCCGIVTGVYVFEMVVVVSAVNAAPIVLSAQIHRALFSHLPNRFMPWLGIGGGATALALLAFDEDQLSPAATTLYAIGAACWFTTFIILVGISRGIDKKITGWVETSLPEGDYPATRKRWDHLMYTRGALGLVAFSLFTAASMS